MVASWSTSLISNTYSTRNTPFRYPSVFISSIIKYISEILTLINISSPQLLVWTCCTRVYPACCTNHSTQLYGVTEWQRGNSSTLGCPSCLNCGKRRLFFSSFHSSCHYLFPPLIIFFFLRLMHDYDTDVCMLSHWDSQMGSARRVHLPSSVSGQGRHLQSWHHVLRDSLSQYSIWWCKLLPLITLSLPLLHLLPSPSTSPSFFNLYISGRWLWLTAC